MYAVSYYVEVRGEHVVVDLVYAIEMALAIYSTSLKSIYSVPQYSWLVVTLRGPSIVKLS